MFRAYTYVCVHTKSICAKKKTKQTHNTRYKVANRISVAFLNFFVVVGAAAAATVAVDAHSLCIVYIFVIYIHIYVVIKERNLST